MSSNDALAACDRLVRVFERAIALSATPGEGVDDSYRAPALQFAIAQFRMRIQPALRPGWLAWDPVHIALFGGTNTGKSTLVNLLLGREGAGMGVRARFSQYPEAHRAANIGDHWLDDTPTRFRGYQRFRNRRPPRQTDESLQRDGYRPAVATLDLDTQGEPSFAPPTAPSAVVWDAPDFSTEQAGTYLGTVIDLLALADLVLMTVTDESYADHRGMSLLRMLNETGVSSLIVANKFPDHASMSDHLSATLGQAGKSGAPVFRLPEVSAPSTSERFQCLLKCEEVERLREAVQLEANAGPALKKRALLGSLRAIEHQMEDFLGPLKHEAALSSKWNALVRKFANETIHEPYQRNYLDGIHYGELNRTLVHLMGLLQVPGIGPVLDLTGQVVRVPIKLVSRGVKKLLGRPTEPSPRPVELEVLESGVQTWLARTKGETQLLVRDAPQGPWNGILEELESEAYRARLLERFHQGYRDYQERVEREIRVRASRLFEKLKENPGKLATLRGANLVVSATSVALVVKSAGINWSDAVLGPAVAGLWQNLVEWGLGRYLEVLRDELKAVQLQAIDSLIETELVGPVSALFSNTLSADDLLAVHEDFALIKHEVERIAGGPG